MIIHRDDALRWLEQRDESRSHGDALAQAVSRFLNPGPNDDPLQSLIKLKEALDLYVETEAPSLRL